MDAQANRKTFASVLSRVLLVNGEELSDAATPATVPSWDSYNALMLFSELEGAFSMTFSTEEMVAVRNVGDIKRSLQSHGVAL